MNKVNEIYCGDCLELMKEIKSESIDVVITSPPYNLGNIHHTGNYRFNPYNDNLPEKEYQEKQLNVLNTLFRIVKHDGSLFYNHKNRIKEGISISPYQWIFKSNWMIKQELVWFNGSQNFDKCRFYPMTERVYWLIKNKKVNFKNNINHHDFFKWSSVGTKGKFKRAFPKEMVKDLLSCIPNVNIVLDPFCGSGTVLQVCIEMDINYIGIDISEEYCKIARERVSKV